MADTLDLATSWRNIGQSRGIEASYSSRAPNEQMDEFETPPRSDRSHTEQFLGIGSGQALVGISSIWKESIWFRRS